jgi:hypothetical protein
MIEFYKLKMHFNNMLNMTMKSKDLTGKAEFEPFIAVIIGASVVAVVI